MPALFPEWTTTPFRLGLGAAALALPVSLVGLMYYVRSPWNSSQFEPADQPVEFDHRHHVVDDEIPCVYCHRGAETTDYAGIPSTDVCMGCHSQVWNQSPLLEVVRRSYFSDKPVPWNRVHDLPDFVYFSHAVHVRGGLRCQTCHGPVERMARVYQVAPLTMGWCIGCHRHMNPSLKVGAKDQPNPPYASMWGAAANAWKPPTATERHPVTSLTTCTACHR